MNTAYLKNNADIIISFEAKFTIVFDNKHLLLEALDHTALNSERKKQYAVAGDSLLDFILFDYLICKKGYSKGKMDCIRQKLNTDATLAEIGRGIGLKPFIVFPISATDQERDSGSAYYNDTLEALVYVIMKDQGLDTSYRFVVDQIISNIPENEYEC